MHSLSTYFVRVFGRKGKALDLSNLEDANGKVHSLSDIFEKIFADLAAKGQGYLLDAHDKKLLRFRPVKTKAGATYSVVDAGEYGYTQPIVSTKTLNVTHRKGTDEAGLSPFYVHLAIAKKHPEVALFVAHKQGIHGVKTPVMTALRARLVQMNPAWGLQVQKVVPTQLVNKLLQDGEVKAFRFISFDKPSDVADKLDLYASDEKTKSIEMVVTARRGKTYGPQIMAMLNSKKPLNGLVTFEGFNYQKVKVDVEFAKGRRATIDLSRIASIASNLDVTDLLKFDKDGHPTEDSLYDLSVALVADVEAQL
jgi:hypothetical protein